MAAYIPGYNNTADVLGFGFNTQSAMFYQSQHAAYDVHEGVQCDGCGANPLRGIRWRCQSCPDHDICGNCKKTGNFPGHPFTMISVTSTQNQMAAQQGLPQQPESGVHWTTCKGCGANPIRGTLYACMVCPDFDLCDPCNKNRVATQSHMHRFDFFVMPRPQNHPPQHGSVPQPGCSPQPGYSAPAWQAPQRQTQPQPQPQQQQQAQAQSPTQTGPNEIVFTPQETDPNIILLAVEQDVPITKKQAAILRNALANTMPGHEITNWQALAMTRHGFASEYYFQHPESEVY